MKVLLATRWRAKADQVEERLHSGVRYSERAVGEAQGYIRALRECADELEAYTSRKGKRQS